MVGDDVDLSKISDVHTVSGLLKQYLRELPGNQLHYILYIIHIHILIRSYVHTFIRSSFHNPLLLFPCLSLRLHMCHSVLSFLLLLFLFLSSFFLLWNRATLHFRVVRLLYRCHRFVSPLSGVFVLFSLLNLSMLPRTHIGIQDEQIKIQQLSKVVTLSQFMSASPQLNVRTMLKSFLS